MKFPPFLTPAETDEKPTATAEIVEFPRDVTAKASLRGAQRMVERCKFRIETLDPDSPELQDRLNLSTSINMLPYWQEELIKREAAVAMLDADDTLTFRGQMYRAHRSTNGAN